MSSGITPNTTYIPRVTYTTTYNAFHGSTAKIISGNPANAFPLVFSKGAGTHPVLKDIYIPPKKVDPACLMDDVVGRVNDPQPRGRHFRSKGAAHVQTPSNLISHE